MPIKITPIEITDEEIGAVKQKAPDKLPDRPTDAGWGAARIKAFLAGVLIDDKASLLALLRSVISQTNEKLDSITAQAEAADTGTDEALDALSSAFEELDTTVYAWARQAQKPTYTAAEVGAMPADTFIPERTSDLMNDGNGDSAFSTIDELGARIVEHGSDAHAHGDIRVMLAEISASLTSVLDSDDETLDELSEIVAYIKSNKDLIDAITINKVNVADIIDDLSTDMSDKPLSAAQGVVLAGLIAGLTTRFDDFVHAGGEADPTVPDWAKEDTKPTYTPEEIGALPTSHNTNTASHSDIRMKIEEISARLAAVLDSDDETLDELSEIVAYIKNNKELIDTITTSKIGVSDIVNDLLTNASDKPLSAAQGVILKTLIDESLFSNHFGTTSGTICQGNDSRLSNSRTPTSHASTYSTYGLASSSKYGHAKASSTVPKSNGSAAAGSEESTFARGDHVHPHDYPVGFLFVSNDSTSPTGRGIAGTWAEIPEGHSLVGAGSTYTANSTGGAATHTLTRSELPAHTHSQNVMPNAEGWAVPQLSWINGGTTLSENGVVITGVSAKKQVAAYGRTWTGARGDSMAHNNMPPYVAKYMWIRIA